MRRLAFLLLLGIAPALFAEEPQAVKALEMLKPKADSGPSAWTTGPFRYDGVGNITAIGNEAFVYDKVGRVRTATLRGPDLNSLQTQTFTYDEYGNLIGTEKLGQTVSLAVDTLTNRLSGIGYGASGNVETDGTRQYAHDAVGMLNAVRVGSSSQPRIVYAYTADDERLFTFDVSTGTTHWTLRGLDNKVLRDFKQQGNAWSVERDYVYRDGLLLAALKSAGAVEHYTLDQLGTPRLVTDGGGHRIGLHAYWPFGEEWSPGSAQEGSPLQFTGHERDADPSGESAPLDYMHARFYQGRWGRFLAADPSLGQPAQPQSWNRYAYLRNNPLGSSDPTGKCGMAAFATQMYTGYGVPCLAQDLHELATRDWKKWYAEDRRDSAKVAAGEFARGRDHPLQEDFGAEMTIVSAPLSLIARAGAAANVGRAAASAAAGESSSTVELFRAVAPAEAESIAASGGKFLPLPSGTEYKGFFYSADDAQAFAKAIVRPGEVPYVVYRTTAPADLVVASPVHKAAREGLGVLVENSELGKLAPGEVVPP